MDEFKTLFMWLIAIVIDVSILSLLMYSLKKLFIEGAEKAVRWFIGNLIVILFEGLVFVLVIVFIFAGTIKESVDFYFQHIKTLLSMIR